MSDSVRSAKDKRALLCGAEGRGGWLSHARGGGLLIVFSLVSFVPPQLQVQACEDGHAVLLLLPIHGIGIALGKRRSPWGHGIQRPRSHSVVGISDDSLPQESHQMVRACVII